MTSLAEADGGAERVTHVRNLTTTENMSGSILQVSWDNGGFSSEMTLHCALSALARPLLVEISRH